MTTQVASIAEASTATIAWPRLGLSRLAFLGLTVALVVAFLLSLALGSVSIPIPEVVTVLLGGEPTRAPWANIVLRYRLPKAVTAMLAGSALAVSGLQMQTIFRNPLAGPFTLGINSGASLGVALVVLTAGTAGASVLLPGLGLAGNLGLVLAASAGAALVMVVVLVMARRVNAITLLILGLMIGYATNSVVSVLLYFSVAERVQAYVAWTFGSFGGVVWSQMIILAPTILLALAVAQLSAKPLNALLLGENYARSMGLDVRRARYFIIGSSAVLAGAITAFCGPVGFLGVAVPHLCRSLLSTSDHRALVPACTLMGATLALVADLVAHLPGTQATLPLNAVTPLIGGPIVIWVILRRQNLKSTFAA